MGWLSFTSPSAPPSNISDEIRCGSGDRLDAMLEKEVVNEHFAMSIPTVQACVNLICGTIAQLPIYLYKKDEKGAIVKVEGDYRTFLLNEEPDEFINGYNFKYNLTKDFLLHGNGYALIDGPLNDVRALHYIESQNISVEKYRKKGIITKANIYLNGEGGSVKKKPYDFISVLNDSKDGLTGKGLLQKGATTLILAKNEQQYSQSVYENGALPLGVLKTDGRLSKETVEKLRDSWKDLYQGLKNSNKTIILEEGLNYLPMSLKPTDLQLDSSRSYVLSEICRLLNVPESLVSANSNKYGSIEQNNLHFLQYCISPIFSALEKGLNKSLLLEEEKEQGYFWAVDETNVIRTTLGEKMSALKTGLDAGLISVNEGRGELHKSRLEKDLMRFSLGNVFYDKDTSDMIIPNMGGIINLDKREFLKLGEDNNEEQKGTNSEEENSKQSK